MTDLAMRSLCDTDTAPQRSVGSEKSPSLTHTHSTYVKTSDLCNLRVVKKKKKVKIPGSLNAGDEARINAILAKYVTIELVSPVISFHIALP